MKKNVKTLISNIYDRYKSELNITHIKFSYDVRFDSDTYSCIGVTIHYQHEKIISNFTADIFERNEPNLYVLNEDLIFSLIDVEITKILNKKKDTFHI